MPPASTSAPSLRVGWRPSASTARLAHDYVPSLVLAGAAAHEQLYNHSGPGTWLLAQTLAWAVVLRRRAPLAVLGLTLALSVVGWVAGDLLFAQLAVLVALHAVAARRPRAQTLVAGAVVEVAAVVAAFRFAPTGSTNDGIVLLTGLVMTALLLGTAQRTQEQYVEALRGRAEQLELERSQQARIAAAAERARIAREMHDIVAHSVAVMITLSDGAAALAEREPGRSADSMRLVASTGRDALAELRRVLAVLRDPDRPDDATADPSPTLAGLTDLVADVRRTGLQVDLDVTGPVDGLPDGVQATAYRAVQEALTNTLKHADSPTRVTVRVSGGGTDDAVEVLVRDDGRPAQGATSPAGSGIRGMTERATLFGGRVDAGPVDGGWQVRLRLPVDAQHGVAVR